MRSRAKSVLAVVIMLALVALSVSGVAHAVVVDAQARSVAAKRVTTPIPSPTPEPHAPALAVRDKGFVDAQGKPVTLVGVTRLSFEYLCHGDGHMSLADFQQMRAWGINTVRLTLSSEFWSGAGDLCPDYHQTIAEAVDDAETAGLYVILTLQWDAPLDTPHDRVYGGAQCPMPDTLHDVALWRDLAQIYHDDQRVLFDLFSEPHDVTWQTWLNGGVIANAQCYLIGQSSNSIETGTYQAIGMRDLAAQVRGWAPNTILIISGIDWGYNLAAITKGYALALPNIVYSTHPFDYATKSPKHWDTDIGATAQQYPIIAAEFGEYDCGTSYAAAAINYFNAHHISWLAWAWNVGGCGGPALLGDWSGKPTQPYGAFIQQQIQALPDA